jgi:hypothetical protein
LIALMVLIGLGVAYYNFLITSPVYRSSMALIPNEIRNAYCKELVNNLSIMAGENNAPQLAKSLKLDPHITQSIVSVVYEDFEYEGEVKDTILIGHPFFIHLSLLDNTLFDTIGVAMVNYLENNNLFLRKKMASETNYREMVNKLDSEIAKLDSVKNLGIAPKGPVNGFVFGEPIDPVEMYKEGIEMYQKRLDLNSSLALLANFDLVSGFAPTKAPVSPDIYLYLANGALISLLLGLIVAHNLEKRKNPRVQYPPAGLPDRQKEVNVASN